MCIGLIRLHCVFFLIVLFSVLSGAWPYHLQIMTAVLLHGLYGTSSIHHARDAHTHSLPAHTKHWASFELLMRRSPSVARRPCPILLRVSHLLMASFVILEPTCSVRRRRLIGRAEIHKKQPRACHSAVCQQLATKRIYSVPKSNSSLLLCSSKWWALRTSF